MSSGDSPEDPVQTRYEDYDAKVTYSTNLKLPPANESLLSEWPVYTPTLTVQTESLVWRNIPWEPHCRTACWQGCLWSSHICQHWPTPVHNSASTDLISTLEKIFMKIFSADVSVATATLSILNEAGNNSHGECGQ